ncbi:MAG: gfo/Idh/MocA family oxidoreductase, partial [Tannerella sp.]|nr:gfo/Idh/MocA family oxidoreductase [Tannerella sp.]
MEKGKDNVSRRQFLGTGLATAVAFTVVPRQVLGGIGFTAPSDQITIGAIGCGVQSRYLLGEFAKRAKVIAAADVDSRKLELYRNNAEKAGSPAKGFKTYRDFRELLANKSIDAVVIATPD